ncbi:hypothetical protein SCUP515_12050 [Seiridium cupressi]
MILLAPLRKGSWYKVMALPDYRFLSPMSTLDPKTKIEKSKHAAPAYTLSNLLRREEVIAGAILPLLDWLDAYAADKKPMDLDHFFSYTTFDVVGEFAFSKRFGFLEQGKDIENAIKSSKALSGYVSVAGFYGWIHSALLANPFITWLGVLPMGHLGNTTQKALRDREGNEDARFDAISHWFQEHGQNPEGFTIRDIYAIALGAVGAGSDTVACGLQSFVYHMIRHSTAWQRVQGELSDAKLVGRCGGRLVSYADAQKLTYLQACIKESLRVFNPVPMGLPRLVPAGGLTVSNRTLPAGTVVSVSPWVMHRSKEIWGQDAHEFNPDRWLAKDTTSKEKYWIPFGAGYNSCPGQNLAKVELSKIAATIVRDYDICQVDGKEEWSWKAYFTVVPHSWPVFVQKRKTE